jgi:hypothetical protein
MVADAGVDVVSGMNMGEGVPSRALHSEVLQKKEGGNPTPKMSPTRMQSTCSRSVVNAGDMSGWYRMRLKATLMSSLYSSKSTSGYRWQMRLM